MQHGQLLCTLAASVCASMGKACILGCFRLYYPLSTLKVSVAVAVECRVDKQNVGPALVVDVEQRLLLASHKLGRWQHAGGLHHDGRSWGAGLNVVLHLRHSCNRLRVPAALLWTMPMTTDTTESALPCTRTPAGIDEEAEQRLLWTLYLDSLHHALCSTTAETASGGRAAAAAILR